MVPSSSGEARARFIGPCPPRAPGTKGGQAGTLWPRGTKGGYEGRPRGTKGGVGRPWPRGTKGNVAPAPPPRAPFEVMALIARPRGTKGGVGRPYRLRMWPS